MADSDDFQYASSSFPQSLIQSPYSRKEYNYIPDINAGSYSNGQTTLVQFDLGSIYNSTNFTDTSDHFLAIPIVLCSALTSNNTTGALVAPTANTAWCAHAMKANYVNLVYQAELVINGKTIEQMSANINGLANFRMVSAMSKADLLNLGTDLGFGINPCLDNWQSLAYNGSGNQSGTGATGSSYPGTTLFALGLTGGFQSGNGMVNNAPFPLVPAAGATGAAANSGDMSIAGSQFLYCYNNAVYSRMSKPVALDASQNQNLIGLTGGTYVIQSQQQAVNEFKSYTYLNGTNYITTIDTAIIRVGDLLDSMKKIGLVKKLDAQLRVFINTGSVASAIRFGSIIAGSQATMVTSASTSTFIATCPFTQNALQVPLGSAVVGIVTGLGIVRAPQTNLFGGVNLALTGVSHAMTSCRYYYSQIAMKPEAMTKYQEANRAKRVVYEAVLFNQVSNIGAQANFSQLIQSGVRNLKTIVIMPFYAAASNGSLTNVASQVNGIIGVTPFAQYSSPFDTAPCTNGNFSLINLQAQIGGVNVFSQPLNYVYEDFLEQFVPVEKEGGGEYGYAAGLINRAMWESAFRTYIINLERANISDLDTPRNIVLQWTNNTNVSTDAWVFTIYNREIIIDVLTSQVVEV